MDNVNGMSMEDLLKAAKNAKDAKPSLGDKIVAGAVIAGSTAYAVSKVAVVILGAACCVKYLLDD